VTERLFSGDVCRFADWPNKAVPNIAAGVYAIWRDETLVYVGMAGRSLTTDRIETLRAGGTTITGLFQRLRSHQSGRRSGDQFCVYVCDRLVLPTLTPAQLGQVGTGDLSLDALTRLFIHQHLTYRWLETRDGAEAYRLEGLACRGEIGSGRPLLNPRKPAA
jgi:hypothetical protein